MNDGSDVIGIEMPIRAEDAAIVPVTLEPNCHVDRARDAITLVMRLAETALEPDASRPRICDARILVKHTTDRTRRPSCRRDKLARHRDDRGVLGAYGISMPITSLRRSSAVVEDVLKRAGQDHRPPLRAQPVRPARSRAGRRRQSRRMRYRSMFAKPSQQFTIGQVSGYSPFHSENAAVALRHLVVEQLPAARSRPRHARRGCDRLPLATACEVRRQRVEINAVHRRAPRAIRSRSVTGTRAARNRASSSSARSQP